jgi:predicted ATPase
VIVEGSYYTPLSAGTSEVLWRKFLTEASGDGKRVVTVKEVEIPVIMGRTVAVTVAESEGGEVRSCWTTFKHLCEGERGASDYHAICKHFDVVYLEGIPQLSVLQHDRARRFITLIDELYDAGINLIWTAESPPEKIFRVLTPMELGEGAGIDPIEAKKAFGVDHSWKDSTRIQANKAVLSKQTLLIGASMNTMTRKLKKRRR